MKRKNRRKPHGSGILTEGTVVAIALLMLVFLFIRYYPGRLEGLRGLFFTGPAFQETKKPKLPEQRRTSPGDSEILVPTGESFPVSTGKAGPQDVYGWTDEKGVKNFSNLPPPSYVTNFEIIKMPGNDPMSEETKVIIKGNQVIVPVRLGYSGKEVSTYLLLDTGASMTMVDRKVAELLNIKSFRSGTVRVADGRSIRVRSVDLDYIVVGPHMISNFGVHVVDREGNPAPFDGLLGMNFLRGVNYQVDFDREVISWTPLG